MRSNRLRSEDRDWEDTGRFALILATSLVDLRNGAQANLVREDRDNSHHMISEAPIIT